MTDYERDLRRWKTDQSKQGDFVPEPDRNDYDAYGYKKGSVVYENGFILDPYLITLYGKEYALKYPLGKYDKEKLEEKSSMTKQEETIKRQEQTSEAAHEYVNSDAVKPENMQLAYGDFINGARWADEHPSDKLLNEAWDRVWPMLEHLGVCKESVEAEKELFFKALKQL